VLVAFEELGDADVALLLGQLLGDRGRRNQKNLPPGKGVAVGHPIHQEPLSGRSGIKVS
jgi:hypothetical protein